MVVVQTVDGHIRDQLGKPNDETGVGTVPPVDGLIGIAHDEQVGTVTEKRQDQPVLSRVHILELVDRQMPVPPPDRVGEHLVLLDQHAGAEQHVVEIEDATALEPLLIGPKMLGHHLDVAGRRTVGVHHLSDVLVGGEAPGFGPTDLGIDHRSQTRVAEHVAEYAAPVHGQLRGAFPCIGGVATKQGQSQLMQGARSYAGTGGFGSHAYVGGRSGRTAARRLPGRDRGYAERPQPAPELTCGFPGERADDGVIGVGLAVPYTARHSQGEDPRLA